MGNYEEIYEKGYNCYQKEQNQTAIQYFEQVNELEPNFMFAYYLKGLCLIRLGKWEKVIPAFKRVIELDKTEGDAYLNIGTAYYHIKQYDEGIEFIEKGIEIGFKDSPLELAYYNLGLIYKDRAMNGGSGGFLGKWSNAINAFKKCIDLNANYIVAHFQLGTILLMMNCYYDAIEYFKFVVKSDPKIKHSTTLQSLIGLAKSYCPMDDYEATLKYLKQVVQIETKFKSVIKNDESFKRIVQSSYADEFNLLVAK